ncbi:Hypothetical protein CAP_6844 [Chondromyces apiculatus DSM 436]|uniref:Uncharacterized protein n=1 Tax=Chondromyces apiculatus DSM 436 TaxID=1192034 RepID=A0A017TFW7_9BACT|nr:Hypothetical protein CAP_6844 [Chondromyces apiculatus DSM 436]
MRRGPDAEQHQHRGQSQHPAGQRGFHFGGRPRSSRPRYSSGTPGSNGEPAEDAPPARTRSSAGEGRVRTSRNPPCPTGPGQPRSAETPPGRGRPSHSGAENDSGPGPGRILKLRRTPAQRPGRVGGLRRTPARVAEGVRRAPKDTGPGARRGSFTRSERHRPRTTAMFSPGMRPAPGLGRFGAVRMTPSLGRAGS